MAKQLILLAGLHKTGSTSIQETCLAARPALAAAGVIYPVWSVNSRAAVGNHGGLLRVAFRAQPNRFGLGGQVQFKSVQTDVPAVRDQLAQVLARSPDKVLLAAEGFSVFSREEMQGFRDWVAAQGIAVRTICHVRHVESWLDSMVAQRVTGHMRMTIGEAIAEFIQAGGLVQPRVENLLAVFPDAEVRSFETQADLPGGLVAAFLESIGVATAGLAIQRANPGASDRATRLMSRINERFGAYAGGQLNPQALGRGATPVLALRGPKFQLADTELEPLRSMIHAEREWLGRTFGQEFAGARAPTPVKEPAPAAKLAVAAAVSGLPQPVRQWLAATENQGLAGKP